jgi:RND family efflux transporter MFP subunit
MSRIIFRLLTVGSAVIALAGCKQKDHSAGEAAGVELPPVGVAVETVELARIHRFHVVPGTIRARDRAVIAPKVTGEIESMSVTIGTAVEKGDLLATLSAREIAAKLQQAQAGLDRVRRDLDRERALLEREASTPEMVKNLEDQFRIARAVADEAQTMLSYTEIRAPFTGVITRKYANEGDLGTPGKPLIELEDPQRLRVEADVSEAVIGTLSVGQSVSVSIPGYNGRINGTVSEISPVADPTARTVLVKVDIPRDVEARSGQFARIEVPGEAIDALIIPETALASWGQMERVFVVADGHAALRLVRTGSRYEERVEILSGLKPGEDVIVSGAHLVTDGQPLIIGSNE